MKTILFFPEQIESERFFFQMWIFYRIWFPNKNWTQKLSFWKIFFLQNMIIWKVFHYKICRNEKFSIYNLKFWKDVISKSQFVGKNLLHNLILFFRSFSFQNLNFNGKACFKIMPFKTSTKSEKFVVVRGANRVKTLFLRSDVFIEIWFLNINWTQNLIFRKILSPQNEFSNSNLSKSDRRKNSRFKNWSICRKKLHFKIQFFFQKSPFQNLIFNEKVYFKIMPFKISTKSEKFVVFRGGNQIKTLFLRCDASIEIWFLNKNWTQNLFFGNYFSSTNSLFKKICFRNLAERKTLNWKPDIFEIILFKFSLYRKTFASESDSFFRKISFQTLIFKERVCYKVMPFKMSRQSEKLVVVRGANWGETFFFQMWIFHRNLISQ